MMGTGRIMIVDDDASIRSMLSDYFAGFGYEAVTASDGEEALRKFVPGRFDCIISDLIMPKMDGLEFLRKIKMQDSQACFLMITGYPNIDSAINAIKEGADDYVNKPFHMEDIRIKVDRIVDAKKAKKALKKMTGIFWALIISIPLWLILGIILGIIWK